MQRRDCLEGAALLPLATLAASLLLGRLVRRDVTRPELLQGRHAGLFEQGND